jgi:fibronectin-binding autotransporter adhesin
VGSLSLVAGSVLDYELGAANSDRTTITSPGGLSLGGGTLNITAIGGFGAGRYTLLDYSGSLSGSPANLTIGSVPAGYTYSFVDNAANTSIDLVVAIPEPDSLALVLSVGALQLFWRRRAGNE